MSRVEGDDKENGGTKAGEDRSRLADETKSKERAQKYNRRFLLTKTRRKCACQSNAREKKKRVEGQQGADTRAQ